MTLGRLLPFVTGDGEVEEMRGRFPPTDPGVTAVEGAQHPDMALLLARCAAAGNRADRFMRLRWILARSLRIGLKREIAKDQ